MAQAPRKFAFQHPGLDRSEHIREDSDALDHLWLEAKIIIIDLQGNARFQDDSETLIFLSGADFASVRPGKASFLGQADQQNWFALPAEVIEKLPPHAIDLRSAAATWPHLEASIFAQARALLYWQERNRFCGACGHALNFVRGGFMAKCDGCGSEHYPRTDAAVIMAVTDGERILLGRQASWPENRWSVLAGFLEPGESLEQTVIREVFEEASVRVDHAEYAASQPWPFPASLMLGFHAYAKPQEPKVGDELEQARWFSAQELCDGIANGELGISPRLSISRWLIEDWCARMGVSLAKA
ncbi:MAG: NAD(+) diphosphatase [Arenimonas sp.]